MPDPAPGKDAKLPADTLMDFDVNHRFTFSVPGAAEAKLGTTDGPHEWNNADSAKGMMFAQSGGKTAVVYMVNLSTQSPHYAYGEPGPYLNSCTTAKGVHYWGMHPTLLFFDPADLRKTKDGAVNPWEPKPYLQVDVRERFFDASPNQCAAIGGVTGDAASRRLFVVEHVWTGADSVPIVHVFQFQ